MRLLIAEGDKALGLFLSRALEADGHRVRLAHDGGNAVEVFRQDLPELRARCRTLLWRKREARLQLRAGNLELDRLDQLLDLSGIWNRPRPPI